MKLAFSHIKSFNDIFPSSVDHDVSMGKPSKTLHTWETDEVEYTAKRKREYKGKARLSAGCSFRRPDGWQFLNVEPMDGLVDWIAENMLLIDGDSISFEVVVRGDGTALVLARNSVILGSRWLCVVDASTLPPLAEVA